MRSIEKFFRALCFFLVLGFLIPTVFGQGGFLGRKNAFEISGFVNVPLSSGSFFQKNYFQVGDKLISGIDWIDAGMNMQYKRTVGARYQLGIDFVMKSIQVDRDTAYRSFFKNDFLVEYIRNTSIRSEGVRIYTYSFLPTLSISPRGSIANVGISHEIGLGPSFSKIREKKYYYSINEFDGDEDYWTAPDVYSLEANWDRFMGFSFKYGVRLQVPIGYHLQAKLGTSAIVTIYPRPDFSTVENPQVAFYNYSALFFNLQRENFFTLNINGGIIYVF